MHNVPNHYHFVFGLKKQTSPFHLMHYLCLRSCIEVNQPAQVFFYYDHEPYGYYWELIRPFLTLEKIDITTVSSKIMYRDASVRQYKYAHIADFVRLEKLVERGGVYADMDTLFVRPLPSDFFDQSFILGREPDIINEKGEKKPSLCNAWILSEKRSEFGRMWLRQMPQCFDGSWSSHSTVLPAQLSREYPEMIHVAPQRAFYEFIWTKKGIADLLEQKVHVPENVYSIHLWAHLWWDRKRKDFSLFHQGRLNYAYVKRATTTYAALANPFLPKKEGWWPAGRMTALNRLRRNRHSDYF